MRPLARVLRFPVCAFALAYSTTLGNGTPARTDAGMFALYAEAVDLIGRNALFADGVGSERIVAGTLRAYLEAHDPYADFLSAADYAQFKLTGDNAYAGVGMEVEKRHDGTILCRPFTGGPAAAAGMAQGEQLTAVNGEPAHGKSLAALAVAIAGPAGTSVVLESIAPDGSARRRTVVRAAIDTRSVSVYTQGSMSVIRLASFGPDTRGELFYTLTRWRRTAPIVIDLRGNGGGDFHAAVDAAMLLLRPGQQIAAVHRRAGTRSYANTLSAAAPVQPVFLWQDGSTASAAEVFIAALAGNARGITIGTTSAGKGTLQEIFPLAGGGALLLTTAYLSTPQGSRFDGRGLVPMHPLPAGATTVDYARQVAALEKAAWQTTP